MFEFSVYIPSLDWQECNCSCFCIALQSVISQSVTLHSEEQCKKLKCKNRYFGSCFLSDLLYIFGIGVDISGIRVFNTLIK